MLVLTVTSYNVDLNFNPDQLFEHLSKEKENSVIDDRAGINGTAIVNNKTHRFEALQSGNIQKRDGCKVQDQAVEIYFRDSDVNRKVSIPVYPHRKVLQVGGHVELLHVALIF